MKLKDIVALSEQLNKKAFYRTEASGTMQFSPCCIFIMGAWL
jgi:pyruvate/oxaloacetate carboxyltransferase